MLLYLDSCCYNRPFDDLSQFRVRLVAERVAKEARELAGEVPF